MPRFLLQALSHPSLPWASQTFLWKGSVRLNTSLHLLVLSSVIPLAVFLLVHFPCAFNISHLSPLPSICLFPPYSIQTSLFSLFCHVFYFLFSFFCSFPVFFSPPSCNLSPFSSNSSISHLHPIPQFFHFCPLPLPLAYCSWVGCEDCWLFVVIRKHLLTSETSSLALDRWEPSLFPAGTISCLLSNPEWQLHGSDVEISYPLHPSVSTS